MTHKLRPYQQAASDAAVKFFLDSYQKFEIEKNAKNEAYYFILSNGLFKEFAEFCKNYHSNDHHKDCLEFLLSNL